VTNEDNRSLLHPLPAECALLVRFLQGGPLRRTVFHMRAAGARYRTAGPESRTQRCGIVRSVGSRERSLHPALRARVVYGYKLEVPHLREAVQGANEHKEQTWEKRASR